MTSLRYPPFLAGALLAFAASAFYVAIPLAESQGVLAYMSATPIAATDFLTGLLFPGTAGGVLPVGWTLEVEAIFSILFPFLYLLARRLHWGVPNLIALALAIALPADAPLRHGLFFTLGMAAYLERGRLEAMLGDRSDVSSVLLAACAAALLSLPLALSSKDLNGVVVIPHTAANVLLFSAGSIGLVVAAQHARPFRRMLAHGAVVQLGRISYSLYLVHYTVILLLAPYCPRPTGPGMAVLFLGAVLLASIPLSIAGERLIETPAVRVGRRINRRLTPDPRGGS